MIVSYRTAQLRHDIRRTNNDQGKTGLRFPPLPYIVAWDRRIGSNWSYIDAELANARRRKAPKDAWACHGEDEIKLARNLGRDNMFRGWLEDETGLAIEEMIKR